MNRYAFFHHTQPFAYNNLRLPSIQKSGALAAVNLLVIASLLFFDRDFIAVKVDAAFLTFRAL